jgi:hypothetical protein
MNLTEMLQQQLALAMGTLSQIEETTDDVNSRNAAQHSLVKIRRIEMEAQATPAFEGKETA